METQVAVQSILSHERQEEEGESSSSWWTTGSALLRAPSWGGRPLTFSSGPPVLRLWGKGVVTHPPQDVRIWSTWKFPILQNRKKRGSFPSQTLHSKTGNLLWWWMPRPKQKRESRAPTISAKKPTKKARERESKNSNSEGARQQVGGPPDPVVKHHGVAYPHGHGYGGAARDLLVPRAGRTP